MARKDIEHRPHGRKDLPALRNIAAGSPLVSLRNEVNRLFDRFFGREAAPFFPPAFGEEWYSEKFPQLDMSETDKEIKLAVDLPGMSEKDIDVSISGNTLTIKGEKKEEKESKEANYIRTERRYGSFSRVIDLPDEVDPQKAEANFKNGVLEISLPKTEKAGQKKKIDIKTAH